jgi:hypothetical protein
MHLVATERPHRRKNAWLAVSREGLLHFSSRYGLPLCSYYHRGADGCLRSARTGIAGAGQQCCYTSDGRLLGPDEPGAGTPDRASAITDNARHWKLDVEPFKWCCKDCKMSDYCNYYMELRNGSNSHCND